MAESSIRREVPVKGSLLDLGRGWGGEQGDYVGDFLGGVLHDDDGQEEVASAEVYIYIYNVTSLMNEWCEDVL